MAQQIQAERRASDEFFEGRVESSEIDGSWKSPAGQERTAPRRRQIDPTTCERDYSDDEVEFMRALDSYKRAHGRMFPTCSEILEVIRGLGYVKVG
jgi:hypothetical protein